jgi:nitronate monooxygenase
MWPDRRLCDLLGVEIPLIQAPMAGSATPALAGAVSNAGALGSLGCAGSSSNEIRDAVAALRSRTNRPFNLNFFVGEAPRTDAAVLERTRERLKPWYDALGLGEPPRVLPALRPGFDEERLKLVLELKPAVVSFHFGSPGPSAVAALKADGIRLIGSATRVAEAKALAACGFDAIIAQGWEAGGHRGSHRPTEPADGVGTMALTPQVVDAVALPVIAAGGIGDGRGIAAALALGAAGVQMGTAFLSCPEAGTDEARRALLRRAGDTDTMVTDAVSGRSARAARSRYAEEMALSREPLPAFPQMYALSEPILAAAGDGEASFHLYGQAGSLNRELPAADLVALLVEESRAALSRLGPLAGKGPAAG